MIGWATVYKLLLTAILLVQKLGTNYLADALSTVVFFCV